MEEVVDTINYDKGYGSVTLVDTFGDDNRIANVARGSYKKGTKQISNDEQLLRYLIRHEHSSPVEFGQLIFHVKIPIFVARQLVRHRTIKMNETSLRYSEAEDRFYVPEIDQFGPQSKDNKQGRSKLADSSIAEYAKEIYYKTVTNCFDAYQKMINRNISREIARCVLPVSLYTDISISWDLRNFLGFCKLRLDPHAQYEIRIFAQALYDLAKPKFPIIFKAWEDYIRDAHTLSVLDQKLLMTITNIHTEIPTEENALAIGMSKREYTEFCAWLTVLQLTNKKEQ